MHSVYLLEMGAGVYRLFVPGEIITAPVLLEANAQGSYEPSHMRWDERPVSYPGQSRGLRELLNEGLEVIGTGHVTDERLKGWRDHMCSGDPMLWNALIEFMYEAIPRE